MVDIVVVTPASVVGLPPFAEDVFDDDTTPQSLAAFVSADDHILVLALHGTGRHREGVGQCAGFFHTDASGRTSLYLDNLGVSPDHQRRGIGRRLVSACRDAALERGCSSAWLVTEPDNEAANGLYQALEATRSDTVMYELR